MKWKLFDNKTNKVLFLEAKDLDDAFAKARKINPNVNTGN